MSLSQFDERPVCLRSEPKFTYRELELSGLLLIQPKVRRDYRGFFLETWVQSEDITGASFVQENHSRSAAGVIRGMHFQPGQAKLVRCTRGRILDVVVDMRQDSPTFKQWTSVILDDESHFQLFIPDGFAHGFFATCDSDVAYKVSSYYDAKQERGFSPLDPAIGITWRFLNDAI